MGGYQGNLGMHRVEVGDPPGLGVCVVRFEVGVAADGRALREAALGSLKGVCRIPDEKRATFVDPRAIACPILCIAGERDRVNSPGTVKSVATRYRGRARYEELPGHSHWLIGEPGWDKIAKMVIDWLDDVTAQEAAPAATS